MATTDIRFKRMDKEYLSLRESQREVFDKVDGFEGAVLGLNQAVAVNRNLIMENQKQIAEVRRDLMETNQKLDALLQHFEVPYRPPTGFVKE